MQTNVLKTVTPSSNPLPLPVGEGGWGVRVTCLCLAFLLLASCLRDHPLLNPDDFSGQPPLLYLQGQIKGRTSAETFGRLSHPRLAFLPSNRPLLFSEHDTSDGTYRLGYRVLCADTFVGRFPLNYEAARFSLPPDSLLQSVVLPSGDRTGILVGEILLFDDRNNDGVLDLVSRDSRSLPESDSIVGRCFSHLLVYLSDDSLPAVRNRYSERFHNSEDRWTGLVRGFNLVRLSAAPQAPGGEYGVRFRGLSPAVTDEPVILWTDSLADGAPLFYFQQGSGSYYVEPQTRQWLDSRFRVEKFRVWFDFMVNSSASLVCWNIDTLVQKAGALFRADSLKSDRFYHLAVSDGSFSQGWLDADPDMAAGSFRFFFQRTLGVPNECAYRGQAIERLEIIAGRVTDTIWYHYRDPSRIEPWRFGRSEQQTRAPSLLGLPARPKESE